MAFQNVGTPRFFVNDALFCIKSGYGLDDIAVYDDSATTELNETIFEMNPSYQITKSRYYGYIIAPRSNTLNYIAYLGHTFATSGTTVYNVGELYGDNGNVNFPIYGSTGSPEYDGFSLHLFDPADTNIYIVFNGSQLATHATKLGAISVGKYYDMKNAPNLALTLSREGGTKETTAYNGGSYSNTFWSSPPKWGNLGAWELSDPTADDYDYQIATQALSRSGRKIWQLSFSYMDDGDLWGSNQSLATSEWGSQTFTDTDGDLSATNEFNENLLTDDNFFSQVWVKTLSGTLSFIFQPDANNNSPDQFALCKFRNNSLKAIRSSPNTFDISLTIEEVW